MLSERDQGFGVLHNSAVYPGDAVYVGPLTGCQKLSDAAVETLFDN